MHAFYMYVYGVLPGECSGSATTLTPPECPVIMMTTTTTVMPTTTQAAARPTPTSTKYCCSFY